MKRLFTLPLTLMVMLLFTVSALGVTGWYQSSIWSKVENQSLSFIGGTVRQEESGTWFVQNDTQHTSLNISSAEVLNGKVRLNFQSNINKVISLIVTPDDYLAKKGYVVSGSSVGISAAEFSVGRMLNVYGGVSYSPSTGSWNLSYQNSNEYTLRLEQLSDGVLRVWHNDNFGLIPTQLTARDGGYTPKLYLFDPYYFDVRFYDDSGNLVTTFDQKCNFLFNRSGYRLVDVTTERFPPDGNFWIMGVMEM